MNSTTKVWMGFAVAGALALGWACRFEAVSPQFMVNRWTGQVYLLTGGAVIPVPYQK